MKKTLLGEGFNLFSNFGVAFSNISVISGISLLFSYGLKTGGYAVMVWSWPIVAFFTLAVGLCMAEICSAYPHSGAVYYWAYQLANNKKDDPKIAAFWSYLTAWLNILALITMVASASFSIATTISTMSDVLSPISTYGVFILVLLLQCILNSTNGRVLHILGLTSIFWHCIGSFLISLVLLIKTPSKQSLLTVLTKFENTTGWDNVYVSLIGGLMAQFTFTGYDGSAHISEETKNPSVSAPKGIVYSIIISFFVGWFYMISLLLCIEDKIYDEVLSSSFPIYNIIKSTLGKSPMSFVLILAIIGALFLCSLSIMTSASRVVYAFARDGALPKFLSNVNTRSFIPVNSVILVTSCVALLGIPSIFSTWAFNAVVSVSTVATYCSYTIPILCKLYYAKESFTPGPFNLGKWSTFLGYVSVVWAGLISFLFVLPTQYPITFENFNYSLIFLVLLIVFVLLKWRIGAHSWYNGPRDLKHIYENYSEEVSLKVFDEE
jgi:amino acid transporter